MISMHQPSVLQLQQINQKLDDIEIICLVENNRPLSQAFQITKQILDWPSTQNQENQSAPSTNLIIALKTTLTLVEVNVHPHSWAIIIVVEPSPSPSP